MVIAGVLAFTGLVMPYVIVPMRRAAGLPTYQWDSNTSTNPVRRWVARAALAPPLCLVQHPARQPRWRPPPTTTRLFMEGGGWGEGGRTTTHTTHHSPSVCRHTPTQIPAHPVYL